MKTNMKNKLGMDIVEVDEKTFLSGFDPEMQTYIASMARNGFISAIVRFEVLAMDSSSFGARCALGVGPKCQFDIPDLPTLVLGDVPSRFAYPTQIWYPKDETA